MTTTRPPDDDGPSVDAMLRRLPDAQREELMREARQLAKLGASPPRVRRMLARRLAELAPPWRRTAGGTTRHLWLGYCVGPNSRTDCGRPLWTANAKPRKPLCADCATRRRKPKPKVEEVASDVRV